MVAFLAIVALGLCAMQSCKPREVTYEDELEEAESKKKQAELKAKEAEKKAADSENQARLAPLTGEPWLGHAIDGALVSIEFFYASEKGISICRTEAKVAGGRSRIGKASFTADEELEKIEWEGGSASLDQESKTLTATFSTNIGEHQARLQQVSTDEHPEFKSHRTSVPEGEDAKMAHADFKTSLEAGAAWWKANPGWDKVHAVEGIAASGDPVALIRPGGVKPKPVLGEEGEFTLVIETLLPPGTKLDKNSKNVNIVTEIHFGDNSQATWINSELNSGAITQNLTAFWKRGEGQETPGGATSALIYLVKVDPDAAAGEAALDQPISNLLQIDFELPPAAAVEAEESSAEGDPEPE